MSPGTRIWGVGRVLASRVRPTPMARPDGIAAATTMSSRSLVLPFLLQQRRCLSGTRRNGKDGKNEDELAPKSFGDRFKGFDPFAEQVAEQPSDEATQETDGEYRSSAIEDPAELAKAKEGEEAEESEAMTGEEESESDRVAAMFAEANVAGIQNMLGNGVELKGGLSAGQEQALYHKGVIPPRSTGNPALDQLAHMSTGLDVISDGSAGGVTQGGGGGGGGPLAHKFPLPDQPIPWHMQMKYRYHPVLMQITRLIMRHGKLSKAQHHVSQLLNYLRTSPSPIFSPKYTLLPGHPPAHHLPLNPVLYLTLAIDSVAPLVRVSSHAHVLGGGARLEIPHPLGLRQRRRIAFMWILDAVNKKPSMGSGRDQYAHRLASEVIAIVEGSSKVWERRSEKHAQATGARANVGRKFKVRPSM